MVDRSAPLRLAAGRRIARDVQVDVEHEPRTALGAHEVDRQHDVAAVGALQLDAEAPLVLLPRHRQWALDPTVAGMAPIALAGRAPLLELFGLHRVRGTSALRAPPCAPALRVAR